MYKIYINETPVLLTTPEDAQQFGPANDKILILRYPGKKKFLFNIVNQLEKSTRFDQVVIFYPEIKKLWKDFKNLFKRIKAAGGVVFNPQGQVLLIHRRGYWDLPKGKKDPGESTIQAAVREVSEETGLTQITPGKHLLHTWHTYQNNDRRILKKTSWFLMATPQTDLTPQTEEDIDLATWKNLNDFLKKPGKTYRSILDVLETVNELAPLMPPPNPGGNSTTGKPKK